MDARRSDNRRRNRAPAALCLAVLTACLGCASDLEGRHATTAETPVELVRAGGAPGRPNWFQRLFKRPEPRPFTQQAGEQEVAVEVGVDDPQQSAAGRQAPPLNRPIASQGWGRLQLPPGAEPPAYAAAPQPAGMPRTEAVTHRAVVTPIPVQRTVQAEYLPAQHVTSPRVEPQPIEPQPAPQADGWVARRRDGSPPTATGARTAPRTTRLVPAQRLPDAGRGPLRLAQAEELEDLSKIIPITPAGPEEPEIPLPEGPVKIPLEGSDTPGDVSLTMRDGRVTLVARNAAVQSVLNLLAEQQGLNLVAAEDVVGNISVNLNNVPFNDALNSIVAITGCTWTQQSGIVLVSKLGGDSNGGPAVQGKVVQVFPLNFISAADIEPTLRGLMSPIGQVFVSQTSPVDKRRTQEMVVVEDLPASVARIAQYLLQVDQPPRQVLIEAHILQVELKDDFRHGVDWKYITSIAGSDVTLKTVGFANPLASPASFFSLDGNKLDVVVEALQTTSDAKTLANPKVIVANGQEARIQIGAKLGYFVTTTTQTSTLQNVNFLNTGVLLRVTPQISNDNRVLLLVRPEISTGKISPLGLPETNTTEAETTVLLDDGGGMVIGGLIKESDQDTQNKVPLLGDIWGVGRLFQMRSVQRARSEIVIVLVPRIAPYTPYTTPGDQVDLVRTGTPIFQNGLQPAPRPFDPRLPDAINNPRRLRLNRLPNLVRDPYKVDPAPLPYYFPTRDEENFVPLMEVYDSPFDPAAAPPGDLPAVEELPPPSNLVQPSLPAPPPGPLPGP